MHLVIGSCVVSLKDLGGEVKIDSFAGVLLSGSMSQSFRSIHCDAWVGKRTCAELNLSLVLRLSDCFDHNPSLHYFSTNCSGILDYKLFVKRAVSPSAEALVVFSHADNQLTLSAVLIQHKDAL